MEIKKLLLFVLVISNFICLYLIGEQGMFNQVVESEIKSPNYILLMTIAANFIVLTVAGLKDRSLVS